MKLEIAPLLTADINVRTRITETSTVTFQNGKDTVTVPLKLVEAAMRLV